MKKIIVPAMALALTGSVLADDMLWFGFSREGGTYDGHTAFEWSGESLSAHVMGAWGPELGKTPGFNDEAVFGWTDRFPGGDPPRDLHITNRTIYVDDWTAPAGLGGRFVPGSDFVVRNFFVESDTFDFWLGSKTIRTTTPYGNGFQVSGHARGNESVGGSIGPHGATAVATMHGGYIDTAFLATGSGPGSGHGKGTLNLVGTQATVRDGGRTLVGYRSVGVMNLSAGAAIHSQSELLVGFANAIYGEPYVDQSGEITLQGEGTMMEFQYAGIGTSAPGSLTVKSSAKVVLNDLFLGNAVAGYASHAHGNVLVDNAEMTVGSWAVVGGFGYDRIGDGVMEATHGGLIQIGVKLIVHEGSAVIVHNGGMIKVGSGTASPTGAVAVGGSGWLMGNGSVDGDVVNAGGTVAPGTSPGVLGITGNLMMTAGELQIEIGGKNRGTQYDGLDVGGVATLGGTLRIILLNNFVPTIGDEFNILKASAISGRFNQVIAPNGFALQYTSNGIGLIAVPEPATFLLLGVGIAFIAKRRR